jgi:putative transposase
MAQQTTSPASSSRPIWEPLEAVVRAQVQRLIRALVEEEITALLGRPTAARRAAVDAPKGRRTGDGKPRRLRVRLGPITGRRPRVRGLGERVVSRVLPLLPRRTRDVGERLPQLSWQGVARGDFELAWRGLWGAGAPLSATSLARLKASWQLEYEAGERRRRDDLEVVYVWADGLEVKAGLEDSKAARLVLIGALTNGQKVGLAVGSGPREAQASWGAVRRDLRARGRTPWRCPMADGHLGLWAALAEQQPTAAEQRGWNHRITNVVEAIPPKHQAQARTRLGAMPDAESQAACEQLRAQVDTRDHQLAPKAVERLAHDWER